MAWTDRTVCFPDRATAKTAAIAIGVEFPPDDSIPNGNEHYALAAIQAPWASPPVYDGAGEVTTPGVLESGFWALISVNQAWEGHDATVAAIAATGAVRTPADPSTRWAGR